MSAIGLGLAALGRPGYLNLGHGDDLGGDRSVKGLERRCHEVLDAGYEGGVRHFDAARSYGRAEEFLASWLEARGILPGAVTVSSKWGYTYTAGWQVDADPPEVKDLSLETLRRQLAETRSWLGPWLSLYQIHSATVSSGVLDDAGVLEELAGLRDGGVTVGLTVTGTDQSETIDLALSRGGFDWVQATYNLLERSAGPALERAHAAGLRASTLGIAKRGLLKFLRTPQLVILSTVQGAIFLLIFRYVFGGAIGADGGLDYVDFLVPGFITTGLLFVGMGAAAGVAEDLEQGFVDRLRSLPIPRGAVLAGRALADTAVQVWGLAVTAAIGFAVGFRVHTGALPFLFGMALVLLFGYALSWVFATVGLAVGDPETAQAAAAATAKPIAMPTIITPVACCSTNPMTRPAVASMKRFWPIVVVTPTANSRP